MQVYVKFERAHVRVNAQNYDLETGDFSAREERKKRDNEPSRTFSWTGKREYPSSSSAFPRPFYFLTSSFSFTFDISRRLMPRRHTEVILCVPHILELQSTMRCRDTANGTCTGL